MVTVTLVAVIVVALFFDFTNGFHDTANSIATSVSTHAISPRNAVAMAAVLNFAGAFISFKVAATVAKGIVDPNAVTLSILLAGLVGAITWNLITWFLGLPSSSSHALIGGLMGSAIVAQGFGVIEWAGLWQKVLKPSLIAPFAALVLAFALMTLIVWIIKRRAPAKVNRIFRKGQLISGGFVALTHGTNDAQKTMGIIALALVASGHLGDDFTRPPTWVIFSAALTMAVGTYAGGWRIIRTLGTRIAKIDPPQGFSAQTACASMLWTTAHFGFPVSTTQVISGSVMGAASSRGLHAVRWGVAGNIVTAWIFTLPMAALVGGVMELITRLPGGNAIVFALAVVISYTAFAARRWETRRLLPPEALESAPI
ncbi:MAG: inorganic phosphate transporter [Thermoleophilia bacterium]